MTYSSSYNSPCAACKFLRRKCVPGCIFSPHFPPEEKEKFVNVHKIFGARNVAKLLKELLPHQRATAASSLAYEAEARVRDPVLGCFGVISSLQRQVDRLRKELHNANADLVWFACNDISLHTAQPRTPEAIGGGNVDFGAGEGGGILYQTENLIDGFLYLVQPSRRRKCITGCVNSPHFPPEELLKFANVHKLDTSLPH